MTFPDHNHLKSSLEFFAELPPGTEAHYSKNKKEWVRTGLLSTGSWGAWGANWLKGRSFEEDLPFLKNLEFLVDQFSRSISEQTISDQQVIDLHQGLYQALHGKGMEGKEGGIYGLAQTRSGNEEVSKRIKEIAKEIENIGDAILASKISSKSESEEEEEWSLIDRKTLPDIPEESWTDEDWKKAEQASREAPREKPSIAKYYFCYTTALAYNQVRATMGDWNWSDDLGQFENGHLFLGALPIQSWGGQDDLKNMEEQGIKAVLSVVEPFENNSEGWFTSPVKPEMYEEKGIRQLQLSSEDFKTIPLKDLLRGAEYLHFHLSQGNSVYVHCKAGRGRSALVVMVYLMKYHGKTAEEAFKIVRGGRKQAGFAEDEDKYQTLKEVERLIQATEQENKKDIDPEEVIQKQLEDALDLFKALGEEEEEIEKD